MSKNFVETGVAKIKPEYVIPDNAKKLHISVISEEDDKNAIVVQEDDKNAMVVKEDDKNAMVVEEDDKNAMVVEEDDKNAMVGEEDDKNAIVANNSVAENYVEDALGLPEGVPPCKRQRLSKQMKKKFRGQNKARPVPFKVEREKSLCNSLLCGEDEENNLPGCANEKCTYIHDVNEYLFIKQPDIGPICYLYSTQGRCPRGITCRFGKQHINSSGQNILNAALYEKYQSGGLRTINSLQRAIQYNLRKWKYDFTTSEKIIELVDDERRKYKIPQLKRDETPFVIKKKTFLSFEDNGHIELSTITQTENTAKNDKDMPGSIITDKKLGPVPDQDIILPMPKEKIVIDWRDKLYLSPLTTVGNLPFRRVCKEFGVDVTCGEMAMANSILQGKPQEWALVKRHVSEDLFGVQLCGGNPYAMTKCAQLLQEQTSIDFVDVNLGCPIELVYQKGEGSGLLQREKALSSIIQCMSHILTIPLTVKTRTGVFTDKNIAHKLVPKFSQWGASLITIHGRSREQRYTKLADWPYIEQCAELAAPVPLFLNGDILSFEDYERARMECPTVAGVMIGRGALIKPWIFTEIKERRHWDISSSERLDILKKYVNYGLEHWGSDTKGVENTRRFLLEWLSFLYRYIPIGILEKPPQHMNERPPFYHGRDELETLMASSNCQDWVKISEMLLGPVPEKFNFLPKHKANAWN